MTTTPTRRRRRHGDDAPTITVRWSAAGGAAAPRLRAVHARRSSPRPGGSMADLRLAGALRRVPAPTRPSRTARHARPAPHRAPRAARRRRAGATARSSSRRARPRRLVLLLDVSGSMEPYARAFVRFLHAAVVEPQPGRGVRARHPARRASRASSRRAIPTPRVARRGAAGRRLVGRHPARRGPARRSTTSGACGAWRGARSS